MNKLFDMGAEAGVLGSMVIDNMTVAGILELVDRDSFFDEKNRNLFDAILSLWLRERTTDGLLVKAELDRKGTLDIDHLQKVVETVPSSANAMYYARLVAEKKHYRDLIVAHDKMKAILDSTEDSGAMNAQMLDILSGLNTKSQTEIVSMSDAERVADAACNKVNLTETGYASLDGMINGFGPGNMVVLAARPSMGKTALAIGMAINAAKRGEPVFFASLEMTTDELKERIIAHEADVSLQIVKQGRDWDRIEKFMITTQEVKDMPLYIAYGCSTPYKLSAAVLRAKQLYGIKLAIVDYIQLMHCDGKENRQQEITKVSRMCKELALDAGLPLVVLSQLNRGVEARDDKRPRMSDLRESGSIEQDADAILMLYREDYYRQDGEKDGIADVLIKKNRHGPTGAAQLLFVEDCARFQSLSYAEVF